VEATGHVIASMQKLPLINPVRLSEPFDHADWVFEAKFDGFRAAADTVRGRLISRNGNCMPRFDEVLDLLPKGCVFDGELVVLDDAGRPLFNELLFARRRPTYVAFDLLLPMALICDRTARAAQGEACAYRRTRRRLDCAHQRRHWRRAGTLPGSGQC
jgi:hypothetical protein